MTEKTRKNKKKDEPKPAFTALVREGKNAMSFSYGSAEATDEDGNEINVYIWVNGDWKVSIRKPDGARLDFIVDLNDNVNALLTWLKETKQL